MITWSGDLLFIVDFVLNHVAEQNLPNYGNGIIYIEEL